MPRHGDGARSAAVSEPSPAKSCVRGARATRRSSRTWPFRPVAWPRSIRRYKAYKPCRRRRRISGSWLRPVPLRAPVAPAGDLAPTQLDPLALDPFRLPAKVRIRPAWPHGRPPTIRRRNFHVGMRGVPASIGTENPDAMPSRPPPQHRWHDLPPTPSARAPQPRHEGVASERAPRRWGRVEPPPHAPRSKARQWIAPLAECLRATARRPAPRRRPPEVPPPNAARADEPRSPALPPSLVRRLSAAGERRPQPWVPEGRPWRMSQARPLAPRPDGSQVERQFACAPPRRGGRAPPPPPQGR